MSLLLNKASRIISKINGNPEVLVRSSTTWQKKRGDIC
jgi:hypothetical protein